MKKLSSSAINSIEGLINHRTHALLCVLVLALLPHTAWLCSVFIALVTLRKGVSCSYQLLICAMLAFMLQSMISMPFGPSALRTVLVFLPCFLLASSLRSTADWRAVARLAFFMVIVLVLTVNIFVPDLANATLKLFKSVVHEMQPGSVLDVWLRSEPSYSHMQLAHYLLGLQMVGMIFGAITSLLFARWVQAKLFNPGGLQKEMAHFRGEKSGLALLIVVMLMAYLGNYWATGLIPAFLLYFFLAGLSLSYHVLARKKPLGKFVMLFTPIVLIPYVMLPVYLLFGSLDSLFNFRVYLPNAAE